MKNFSLLCSAPLLLVVACVAMPASAQPATRLPEVVVTATRTEQPVSDVVADVSLIDRAQIERSGSNSLAQLLARVPGLQAITFGDASRIYIRGADSRMTALYVDGVRVDSQDGVSLLGGGVPWELLPVSEIERIEVLRGPASAVYGSDAMGGVVQVFTRRGTAAALPYLNMALASLDTARISAGLSGARAGWDYALGWGSGRSGGYNTRPDLAHTPEREASADRSASLRLGYQPTSAQRLELTALHSELDSHYVPWGGGADYQAQSSLSTAALKWKAQWSGAYSTQLSVSGSRSAKQDDVPFDYQTKLRSVLLENNLRLAHGTVTAVLEQKTDRFEAQASGYFDPAFTGERTQNAVALGYAARYGQHGVQLNARNDRDTIFGAHQTGFAGYAWSFAPQWRATLSAGTAFRSPTLEQIFGPYGSATLAPETNRSSEAGLAYANQAYTAKAVIYRNAVRNMISSSAALSTCAAGYFCYYNVGQASIRGATLSATQQLRNYDLRASLDILDPVDDVTGRVLSLRARRSMMLGVDRHLGAALLGAEVQAVGPRFDDAANTRILPGYALLNFSGSTPVGRDWRAVLRVDNVADVKYEQVGHYATPGRVFFAGLQWQARP